MNVYKNYNKESLMFVALGVIFLKLKPCKGSCKKNSSTNGQAIKALPTPPTVLQRALNFIRRQ